MQRQVDQVNPSLTVAPIDAKSPDLKVGVVNIPGVQQQYGKNFGPSAVPFRPPPPITTASAPTAGIDRPPLPAQLRFGKRLR